MKLLTSTPVILKMNLQLNTGMLTLGSQGQEEKANIILNHFFTTAEKTCSHCHQTFYLWHIEL